ncbi:hypothetical protein GCM10022402_35760 [Salinactinospora qingdaonensis]|uniref:Nitroreductase domain-containing protein n=1 Tax=Salinactinospora qingdaonensis TaxID=702744 RepID=A0ABP7G3J5_9ACTN
MRRFDPHRPVPRASLHRILDHARRGPSAGFSQGQAFLVLEGPHLRRFLNQAGKTAGNAPLIIVPIANKTAYLDRYAHPDKGYPDRDETTWTMPYWLLDTAMAALLILQTAVDEGLGAWFFALTPHHRPLLHTTFDIPHDHDPIGAIAIGYSAQPHPRDLTTRRRPRDEIIHYGHWGHPLPYDPNDPTPGNDFTKR